MTDRRLAPHPGELHRSRTQGRLNWLRAGVLGANDGIVSVAAVVVGVAAGTPNMALVIAAGSAALVGGAISMALGEYVSVSSQSDSERATIAQERRELADMPAEELDELAAIYREKGLTESTARLVAAELTAHDALRAHLDAELHIDPDDLASPWRASLASAIAFTSGGVIPFLAILAPAAVRLPLTFGVVLVALATAGTLGARLGGSPVLRPALRVVVGGALALSATFGVGSLLGTTGIG